MDPSLRGAYPRRCLNYAVAIIAMCLNEEAHYRPFIGDIVVALEYLAAQSVSWSSERILHVTGGHKNATWLIETHNKSLSFLRTSVWCFVRKCFLCSLEKSIYSFVNLYFWFYFLIMYINMKIMVTVEFFYMYIYIWKWKRKQLKWWIIITEHKGTSLFLPCPINSSFSSFFLWYEVSAINCNL